MTSPQRHASGLDVLNGFSSHRESFSPHRGQGQRESLRMQHTLTYDSALIHRVCSRVLFTRGFLVQSSLKFTLAQPSFPALTGETTSSASQYA